MPNMNAKIDMINEYYRGNFGTNGHLKIAFETRTNMIHIYIL
jgi:hypothetical protein